MAFTAIEPIHALAGMGELALIGIGLAMDMLGELEKHIEIVIRSRGGRKRHEGVKQWSGRQPPDQSGPEWSSIHGTRAMSVMSIHGRCSASRSIPWVAMATIN